MEPEAREPISSDIETISVLLIDENRLFRAGLRRLLSDATDIKVIGDTAPGDGALRLTWLHQPDIVLIGVHAENEASSRQLRDIAAHSPRSKIIVMLPQSQNPQITRLLLGTATGALSHESSLEDAVTALKRVHGGKYHIAPEITHHLIGNSRSQAASVFDTLSARELEVLTMIIDGMRSSEIASRLSVSPRTVGTFRQRIFTKLQARTDADLVRLALASSSIRESAIRREPRQCSGSSYPVAGNL